MVADGVTAALAADDKLVRTQVKLTIPETNPEMDVYRIGTLLEMVRELVTSLCADGKPVKVCVQGSMGRGVFTALPLALSGVNRILENMDWGDAEEFVRFGAIGADEVDDSYAYIIVAPQNMVGASVIESLEEMSKKVEEDGKRIILVNPKLEDRASSGGVMGVRGRSDRLAFAATFDTIVAFRLLYTQGTFYPIVGALRYVYGEGRKWEIYDRVDLPKRQERYDLIATFDSEPTTSDITESFARVYG
ncbi:unnamed protein product [Pedinophyceae sp. YPF-701]|nr:unnamed protein product [Pedinophyceae sp. YPF-701]